MACRRLEPAPSAANTVPNGTVRMLPGVATASVPASKSIERTELSKSMLTRPVASAASRRMAFRSRLDTEWITSWGRVP